MEKTRTTERIINKLENTLLGLNVCNNKEDVMNNAFNLSCVELPQMIVKFSQSSDLPWL